MSGTPDSVERLKFERPKLGLEKSIQKRISSENFCHKFASESFNGSANRKKVEVEKRLDYISLSHSLNLPLSHQYTLSLFLSLHLICLQNDWHFFITRHIFVKFIFVEQRQQQQQQREKDINYQTEAEREREMNTHRLNKMRAYKSKIYKVKVKQMYKYNTIVLHNWTVVVEQ